MQDATPNLARYIPGNPEYVKPGPAGWKARLTRPRTPLYGYEGAPKPSHL